MISLVLCIKDHDFTCVVYKKNMISLVLCIKDLDFTCVVYKKL